MNELDVGIQPAVDEAAREDELSGHSRARDGSARHQIIDGPLLETEIGCDLLRGQVVHPLHLPASLRRISASCRRLCCVDKNTQEAASCRKKTLSRQPLT